jgi:hypothetical protein
MENNNIIDRATPSDEVAASLSEVGITEQSVIDAVKALGVNSPEDFAELEREDLVAAGLNPVQASKLIKGAKPTAVASDSGMGAVAASIEGILPTIPDDESWLNALKIGGVLKPDRSTVIAAIRAALAEKVGFFDLPVKLLKEMERFADENDEPVDPTFFKLRQQVTQRTYAEVFEAIPGLDSEFVTDVRKRQLFERMRTSLLPSVAAGYKQLKAWHDNWTQGAANPAMMMLAITGGNDGGLPAGMMAPPDTGPLRDCGEDINNAINAAFKGVGSQIASALAYDASQIRKIIEDPRLPALIGTPNRDQMLKKLGISVSANYTRQEQNLVKFILGFMQVKDIAAESEAQYFSALCMLGNQIDRSLLEDGGAATLAARPQSAGRIRVPDRL